jgi:hypothetical protein
MTRPSPVAIAAPALPLADPADRATFTARKLEHLRWERETLAPGALALAQVALDNATDALASATSAASNATATAASAANVSALSNFKGTWASLAGAIAKPASAFHNGAYWALLNNLADVTLSQPGVTADWQVVGGAFPIVPINSNTTAVPWKTYLIYGACTLTLPAISGNGKQVGVVVLTGVTGAVLGRTGSDKIRNVAEAMTFDAPPFNSILTDTGATYGWV